MFISIIITSDPRPGVVPSFLSAINQFCGSRDLNFELLLVDDLGLKPSYKDEDIHGSIRLISASDSMGQLKSVESALFEAKGEVIFLMNPDMGDNIKDMDLFLEKIKQGKEIVYANRIDRVGELGGRKLARLSLALISNALLHPYNLVSDMTTPMLAIRSSVVAHIPRFSHHLAKMAMPYYLHDKYAEVDISVHVAAGSNYSFLNLSRLFFSEVMNLFRLRRLIRQGLYSSE